MLTTWDLAVGRTGSTLTPLIAATHHQSSFWLHTFLPSVGIMTYVNNDSSSVNIKLKNWNTPRLLHHVCVLRRFDWHNNDWEVGSYNKIKVAVVWTDYHQIQSGGTNSKMIREINDFLIMFLCDGRRQLAVPIKASRRVKVLSHPNTMFLVLKGGESHVKAVGGTDQPLRSGGCE